MSARDGLCRDLDEREGRERGSTIKREKEREHERVRERATERSEREKASERSRHGEG